MKTFLKLSLFTALILVLSACDEETNQTLKETGDTTQEAFQKGADAIGEVGENFKNAVEGN
ncbi:hypothetical protein P3T73_17200 [Kiritimatiellota bacterium B12222]|nr:hypothetical protein P3T73_17200 [Kiritimatiellota bacterium B12222]